MMYLNSFNKSVNITFIRHGTTKFNEEDRVQGSSDIQLSQKGIDDINTVNLENMNYDIYIHSPLSRSKDTLLGILNKYDINIQQSKIKEDILVTERKYGIFEGLTKKEIKEKYPDLYHEWTVNENLIATGIENIEHVIDRIKLFISKIISYEHKNILVVTHSGFLYALYKYINNEPLNLKPNDMKIKLPNCCIVNLYIKILFENMELLLTINGQEFKKIINF